MSLDERDWIAFMEKRLDSWTSQMGLLISAAGIVPASAFTVFDEWFTAAQAGASVRVAVLFLILIGILYYLLRVITRRRYLLAIIELTLRGILRTPQEISLAYRIVFRSP